MGKIADYYNKPLTVIGERTMAKNTVESIQGFKVEATPAIWVDPNSIVVDPAWNYRSLQEDKVEEYKKSMESLGFLSSKPLVCIREGNNLVLREGLHRLKAACKVRSDVDTFQVAVVLENPNEAVGRQLIKSLVGNSFAQDSAIERGRLYSEVQALKMSIDKIASYTGRDVKIIKAEIALFEASGEVLQKAISDKRISLAVAKEIVNVAGGDEYAQNERVELYEQGQQEEKEAKEALQELQKEVQESLGTPTPPTLVTLLADSLSDQLDDALTDEQKERLEKGKFGLGQAVDKQEQAIAPTLPAKSPLLVLEEALSEVLSQVVALDGSEEEEDYLPDGGKFSSLSLELQDKIIVAYKAVEQEKKKIITKAKTAVRGGKKAKPEVNVQPKGGTPPDGVQDGTGEDGPFQRMYAPRVSLFQKMLMKGSHGQGFRDVKEAREALVEAIQTDNDYYVIYLLGVLSGMGAPNFSFLTLKH